MLVLYVVRVSSTRVRFYLVKVSPTRVILSISPHYACTFLSAISYALVGGGVKFELPSLMLFSIFEVKFPQIAAKNPPPPHTESTTSGQVSHHIHRIKIYPVKFQLIFERRKNKIVKKVFTLNIFLVEKLN